MKYVNTSDALIIYWLIKYKKKVENLTHNEFLSFIDQGKGGNLLYFIVKDSMYLAFIYKMAIGKKCPPFKINHEYTRHYNWPFNEKIKELYEEDKIYGQ